MRNDSARADMAKVKEGCCFSAHARTVESSPAPREHAMTYLRLHSRYAFVLVASMLALGVVSAPAAAAETPGVTSTHSVTAGNQVRAPVPRIDWLPCGPGLEPFLCATAEVPSDYDLPHGRTTTIALTKLPAGGGPAGRMGTLFINPGGPGDSGV